MSYQDYLETNVVERSWLEMPSWPFLRHSTIQLERVGKHTYNLMMSGSRPRFYKPPGRKRALTATISCWVYRVFRNLLLRRGNTACVHPTDASTSTLSGGIFVWNVIRKSLNLQARMFGQAVYSYTTFCLDIGVVLLYILLS